MRATGRTPAVAIRELARIGKMRRCCWLIWDLGGTACNMLLCPGDSLIFFLVVGSLRKTARRHASSRCALVPSDVHAAAVMALIARLGHRTLSPDGCMAIVRPRPNAPCF